MSNKQINFSLAVSSGWNIVTKNIPFFIVTTIILVLTNFGQSYINNIIIGNKSAGEYAVYAIFNLLFFILNILISLGLIKVSLEFLKNNKPKIKDIFSQGGLIVKYFLGSLLIGLLVMLPILLPWGAFGISFMFQPSITLNTTRIILGIIGIAGVCFSIYLSLRFMFFQYFLVDKNSKIIEAIKMSGKITNGVKWQLILFGIICFGIAILGILAFIIGLAIAIPIIMVATASIYLQLSEQITNSNPIIPTPNI